MSLNEYIKAMENIGMRSVEKKMLCQQRFQLLYDMAYKCRVDCREDIQLSGNMTVSEAVNILEECYPDAQIFSGIGCDVFAVGPTYVITLDIDGPMVDYEIFAPDFATMEKLEKTLMTSFNGHRPQGTDDSITMRWFYITRRGDLDSASISQTFDDILLREAYPYLDDVDAFVDDYLRSPDPVLLLIGPPGTGKTRLIRRILKRMSDSHIQKQKSIDPNNVDDLEVGYTTDPRVLTKEQVFWRLLCDDMQALVVEDADTQLRCRVKDDNPDDNSGNPIMYQLLAASDGLIAAPLGKIILSTNLKDVSHIDPALVRPGRCYEVLKTRLLTNREACDLVKEIAGPTVRIDMPLTHYSLADVYRKVRRLGQDYSLAA